MRRASIFTRQRGLQPHNDGKLLSCFNKYLLSLSKINPRLLQNLLITLSLCLDGYNFFHGFLWISCPIWHNKITQVPNIVSSLLEYVHFLHVSLHYFAIDIYIFGGESRSWYQITTLSFEISIPLF